MKKILHKSKMLFLTTYMLIVYMAARVYGTFSSLFTNKYKDLWLVSERGIDARDNGYVFWEYLCRKHPEINAYYVIDFNSKDYDKVSSLGKCVRYGSFEHFVMLARSEYNVSTHIMGYTPHMIAFVWLDRVFHIIKGKKIFLQHGIIKDDMPFNHYPHTPVDIFNTSARPEYEFIRDTFGHPSGVVQMLGLPRYDKLPISSDSTENQILIMPTWRQTLVNECSNEADFRNTEYYKKFNSLINNTQLINFLNEKDFKLIFYPHIEFQKYLGTFTTSSDRVILGSFNDYDVQKLLIESKLLVTDYSSVYFDFAYMHKPEIYFQFDKESYRKGHYGQGYFVYEEHGFGPVLTEEDDVVKEIIEVAEHNWHPSAKYAERMENFFTLRDQNNCERVFEAIGNL